MTTSYDTVAYPRYLAKLAHPDHLAVFGRLHGLSPAAAATARVLEIGCGDGYNLLGLAAVYPEARLEGFDLAETPIRAGQAMVEAAGLSNVSLWVGDIMTASERIAPGSFDYVIAHGVYAWVPEVVREATMALAAHALAPHGIFYVSYNALPGGHFRMAMRDVLLHEIDGITDPAARMARVREVLTEIRDGGSKGSATVECLQVLAEALLDKNEAVLFHDELGDIYAPHSLTDAAANGARAGLRYLNDADFIDIRDGFVAPGTVPESDPAEVDRRLIRRAQSNDNRNTCFFRNSLFVRADAPVGRVLDVDAFDTMWMSTALRYDAGRDAFVDADGRATTFGHDEITAAFHRLAAAQPARLPVREVVGGAEWREPWITLVNAGRVALHNGPAPFVAKVGEQPETAPFVRFQIEAGSRALPRLDHQQINVDGDPIRALLLAANGERTVAEIAREVDGVFPAHEVEAALNGAAAIALMRR